MIENGCEVPVTVPSTKARRPPMLQSKRGNVLQRILKTVKLRQPRQNVFKKIQSKENKKSIYACFDEEDDSEEWKGKGVIPKVNPNWDYYADGTLGFCSEACLIEQPEENMEEEELDVQELAELAPAPLKRLLESYQEG